MKVKVNDRYDFEITHEHDVLKVGGAEVRLDSARLSGNHVNIIYQNRSYNIELVSENKPEKTSVIKVNGNLYHIAVQDQYDLLLKQLGLDSIPANKMKEIKAPMPGLVLNVIVEEGQQVSKGDNLLVLEAMKMENIIKSPAAGIVKKVLINKGAKVEKNEILIQFS